MNSGESGVANFVEFCHSSFAILSSYLIFTNFFCYLMLGMFLPIINSPCGMNKLFCWPKTVEPAKKIAPTWPSNQGIRNLTRQIHVSRDVCITSESRWLWEKARKMPKIALESAGNRSEIFVASTKISFATDTFCSWTFEFCSPNVGFDISTWPSWIFFA